MRLRALVLAGHALAVVTLAPGACSNPAAPDLEGVAVDTVVVTDTVVARDTVVSVVVDTVVIQPDTVLVVGTTLVTDTIIVGVDTVVMVDTVFIADTVLVGPDTVFVVDTVRLTPRVLWVTERCSDHDPDDYVTFADVQLAETVAQATGASPGNVTCAAAAKLKELTYAQTYLTDLRGLQNLVGLEVLQLRPILLETDDLSPLAYLTRLRALRIGGFGKYGSGSVMDLAPLAALGELESLSLDVERRVRDLTPLGGLARLDRLYLRRLASPANVAPLAGLTELTGLSITETALEDLGPLADLSKLRLLVITEAGLEDGDLSPLANLVAIDTLALSLNPGIRDIQPLLFNPGLGSGDRANFVSTSVGCGDIERLEARGVTVAHDCLRIATVSLPDGEVGKRYETLLTFEPTGWGGAGPPVWTLAAESGPLPPGLSISDAEERVGAGRIAGTPTAVGSWTVTVAVRDPPPGTAYRRSAEREFTIVVGAPES
jgi:hypothetical protein